MPFENITLDQLRALTKEQILTAISNRLAQLTKKQLIILILRIAGQDLNTWETTEQTQAQDGPNGQIARLHTTRNALGELIRSQTIDWNYYQTGEVNEITITGRDASDAVTARHIIKHFLDGRQPVLLTE